jgi:hypothetical protein
VQRAFLERHAFVRFARVATADEVAMLAGEIERIEAEWLLLRGASGCQSQVQPEEGVAGRNCVYRTAWKRPTRTSSTPRDPLVPSSLPTRSVAVTGH